MSQFPARIHVLLASEALLGVVIRRGPSKQVATMLWDRERDEFAMGQWLKGRIYERRCDLSPDGKYFIYFALKGNWQSETTGAWTAISRAPYLKALYLYPEGATYYGGGLWTGATTFWKNGGEGHAALRTTTEVRREPRPDGEYEIGCCTAVYYPRLVRDGWRLTEHRERGERHNVDVFEKQLSDGWLLRKIAHSQGRAPAGKSFGWDEHQLIQAESGRHIECPDWEWAALDRDRLVWAADGKLYCAHVTVDGLTDEAELYDFNQMTFEPIKAPY